MASGARWGPPTAAAPVAEKARLASQAATPTEMRTARARTGDRIERAGPSSDNGSRPLRGCLVRVKADFGTGSWVNKSLTFTTDFRCAKGYISAHMYKGYGVLWVDDVEVK
jgi:hypothetical protein